MTAFDGLAVFRFDSVHLRHSVLRLRDRKDLSVNGAVVPAREDHRPTMSTRYPYRSTRNVFRRMVRPWNRRDWLEFSALGAAIAALHLIGFGSLVLLIAPHHYQVGTQDFVIGLGITAYTFGLRHAFDADHIAGIVNVVALIGTWRVFLAMRRGEFDEAELEDHLNSPVDAQELTVS